MTNEIKFCPAMVRCGENPRNAVTSIRAPKAGFFIISKIVTLCTNQINPTASRMLVP